MYHVLLQMIPDDCMGARIRDFPFVSHKDALAFYNRPYSSLEMVKKELLDLYGVDEWEDGWHLHAIFDVILIECEIDVFKLPRFFSEDDCTGWMNNWDGIGLVKESDVSKLPMTAVMDCDDANNLQEIYKKYGAVTLSSYWMEFDIDNNSIIAAHHEIDDNVVVFEGEELSKDSKKFEML